MVCNNKTTSHCVVGVPEGLPKKCRDCGYYGYVLLSGTAVCGTCGSTAVRSLDTVGTARNIVVLGGENRCFSSSYTCSTCGGTGKITQNINCIHGRNSSHGYCVHGQLGQHE